MDLIISIVSRGLMEVKIGYKELHISGELTFKPPVFYANIDSIKNWNPPFQNLLISEEEKKDIIEKIIEKSKDSGTLIVFD